MVRGNGYRADVDGLRAVAVLSVAVFHAFPELLPGGFVGVDIFFVISGYLICKIILEGLENRTFSFVDFYVRRIRRIFPALLAVLFAAYVFGWYGLLATEYRQLGLHIAAGAGFVSNLTLWHESGYFDNAAVTKPLLHLWSLGVEEQFYLVWPLLLWALHKLRLNLFTAIAAIAVVSFLLNLKTVRLDPVAAFYSPQTRFWELMVGALLAQIENARLVSSGFERWCERALWWLIFGGRTQVSAPIFRHVLSIVGSSLILIGLSTINERMSFPGWWATIPTAGAALMLAAGGDAVINHRLLSLRLLVAIGLISYPLYLWHWPILTFARLLSVEPPPTIVLCAALALSLFLAIGTYALIERPVRFGGARRTKAATLVVLMMLLAWR